MMDSQQTILIVEDEKSIREVIRDYLQREGFHILEANNAAEALHLWASPSPSPATSNIDFVILDLMLPDQSGEALCKAFRATSDVPIIMLTAKSAEHSKVAGLELGADDYMTKPFSARELVARVRTILRRTNRATPLTTSKKKQIVVDDVAQRVYKQGQEVNLTPKEYMILRTLTANPGRTFSRSELIESAFGYDYEGDERVVDQHIKGLRQKLEDDAREPRWVQTVFGFGYRFVNEEE